MYTLVLTLVFLNLLDLCWSCPHQCQCDLGRAEIRCSLDPKNAVLPSFDSFSYRDRFTSLVLSNCSLTRANLVTVLSSLRHVSRVDLSQNQITSLIDIQLPNSMHYLRLDLSNNLISSLDVCRETDSLRHLKSLILRGNALNNLTFTDCPQSWKEAASKRLSWQVLDLSNNQLEKFDFHTLLNQAPYLLELNVSSNALVKLSDGKSPLEKLHYNLKILDASNNMFSFFRLPLLIKSLNTVNISRNIHLRHISFSSIRTIKRLDVSDCLGLSEFDSIAEIQTLNELDLSGCVSLRRVDFSLYPKLLKINLSRTNVTSFMPPIPWLTSVQGFLDISMTNNWNCSCDILWVSGFKPAASARCGYPRLLRGRSLPRNMSECETPFIRNFTAQTVYALGEKAKLECRVGGHPHPMVLWKTPSQNVFVYRKLTSFKYFTSEQTQGSLFHRGHRWHGSHVYRHYLSDDKRLHYILTDGSLYLDYVTRSDAGSYSCTVLGPNGNSSLTMQLSLNYDILRAVRWHSQIVGMICASCMIGIGISVGIAKMVARRCRRLEIEKHHRTLRVLIENLETYRADKVDKFRAYRTNKMNNYTGQMSRIKESCITHMMNMQDHYNRRIAKIRENYVLRIEGLRDSYTSQVLRIKDYRWQHVDRLRENYNQQILRIREYASGQLLRIREQYRLQQQLFIKLLEALSLENCMAVDVDELDDAMSRGAQVGLDSDDDADDMILNEHLPRLIAHLPRAGDVEMGDVIDSLPSLPAIPDLDFFIPPPGCDDNCSTEGMSPVRSSSPVSDDYQTADSDYEVAISVNQVVVCLDARPRDDSSITSENAAMT